MQQFADPRYKPLIRLKNQLRVGAAFNPGDILYEFVNVGGAARVQARMKTVSGGGNLELIFVAPDLDFAQLAAKAVPWGSISQYGTAYVTGNPTPVAIVAATESQIVASCYGEGYAAIKFTANVAGTIAYVDVGRV